MTQPEQVFSLAASPEADVLRLELIDRTKQNGATWAVIGSALGMSGREAKRHAHKLSGQVKRAAMTTAAKSAATEGTPVRVPHIDFDTPTGNPLVVARQGYGLTPLGSTRARKAE